MAFLRFFVFFFQFVPSILLAQRAHSMDWAMLQETDSVTEDVCDEFFVNQECSTQ